MASKVTSGLQNVRLEETSDRSTLALSDTLETTLFSRLLRLYGPKIRRMLSTSYRFNTNICAFPSVQLYNDELVSDASVASIKLSDLEGVERDEDLDEPIIFIDSEFGPVRLNK